MATIYLKDFMRFNYGAQPMCLPPGQYEAHAVDEDGSAVIAQNFGEDIDVHVHPSEFRWISEPLLPKGVEPMAKKKAGGAPAEQQTFEGDGFPEPPPKEVAKARDEYLGAMRATAEARETKGEKEVRLIEVMQKHGIDRIKLDAEGKFFEVERKPKVKMKTIPKAQRDAAGVA